MRLASRLAWTRGGAGAPGASAAELRAPVVRGDLRLPPRGGAGGPAAAAAGGLRGEPSETLESERVGQAWGSGFGRLHIFCGVFPFGC